MPQVYCAALKPASAAFRAWEWVEAVEVEGCATYADYEEMLDDPYGAGLDGRWEVTEDLSGRIHNEQGRVYRLKHGDSEENPHSYEMVWIDEEEL